MFSLAAILIVNKHLRSQSPIKDSPFGFLLSNSKSLSPQWKSRVNRLNDHMTKIIWIVERTGTRITQIAKFMGPTWGPPGSCRPQMGPIMASWTLLSGKPQGPDQTVWPHLSSCSELKRYLGIAECIFVFKYNHFNLSSDSKVHGANMGPSGADRTQVGPMLAPWTLLSGSICQHRVYDVLAM